MTSPLLTSLGFDLLSVLIWIGLRLPEDFLGSRELILWSLELPWRSSGSTQAPQSALSGEAKTEQAGAPPPES